MKAIKIDAAKRKVIEIEIIGLTDMQEAVGGLIEVGHYFPGSPDVIYVDEEGLLKNPEHFFMIEGETEMLAGNGLIVGTNRLTGASANCITPIEYIKKQVMWMDAQTMGLYLALKRLSSS